MRRARRTRSAAPSLARRSLRRLRPSVSAGELLRAPRRPPLPSEAEEDASVLSDFDVLNDAIQEVLLDSDSDADAAEEIVFAVAPFPHCARRRRLLRRRPFVAPLSARRAARPLLPATRARPAALCVVLDLDETLVSARRGPVVLRPHLRELLDACRAEGCEVVVWSAGAPSHVNAVVRDIAAAAGRRDWYDHLISRHRRWFSEEGESVKDLAALGRQDGRLLLLENSPQSVQRQPRHAVLVEDYVQPNGNDDSLRILAGLVRRLAAALRSQNGTHPTTVSQQLDNDDAVVDLLFPLRDGSGTMETRGLLYSPKIPFSERSYGGEHPLLPS